MLDVSHVDRMSQQVCPDVWGSHWSGFGFDSVHPCLGLVSVTSTLSAVHPAEGRFQSLVMAGKAQVEDILANNDIPFKPCHTQYSDPGTSLPESNADMFLLYQSHQGFSCNDRPQCLLWQKVFWGSLAYDTCQQCEWLKRGTWSVI